MPRSPFQWKQTVEFYFLAEGITEAAQKEAAFLLLGSPTFFTDHRTKKKPNIQAALSIAKELVKKERQAAPKASTSAAKVAMKNPAEVEKNHRPPSLAMHGTLSAI